MRQHISFTLNGRPVSMDVGAHEDAVDVLRRRNLFGARESCGQGLCGCCTIKVDGVSVSGCLTLGLKLDGTEVETVEGLEREGVLDVVQQAFIDAGAFQCGFCTPGFLMMASDLLARVEAPTDEQIKDHLAGNLCRCAAYPEIIAAVRAAAEKRSAHAQV
jgi:aerobic-type carbon monoxide dehydrogenase small subunit (CoxS/CutS family)